MRPPIARGLRFSHRCCWTEHGKSSNRANYFFSEIAAPWGVWTPSVVAKTTERMSPRQRLARTRDAGRRLWRRGAARKVLLALSFYDSAMAPIAGVDALAPIGTGEDADLGFLADRANPERGDRLATNRAARCTGHVQVSSKDQFEPVPASCDRSLAQGRPRAGR